MIKKSNRVYHEYEGLKLSVKQIYGISKKRRDRSKYLLSVNVMIGKDQKIPAKIICVRNKKNKKDWVAFICTNTKLSEVERSSAFMGNAGRSKSSSRPASPTYN